MSEISGGYETRPEVIQFCIRPELVALSAPEYVESSRFAVWDLPSAEVVTPVATAILYAIEANGIDPKSVVLSGYSRHKSQGNIDDFKRETYAESERESHIDGIAIKIAIIHDELSCLYKSGILTQSKQTEARIALRGLLAQRTALKSMPAEEKPTTYFFAEHTSMFNNHTGDNNPIFYAGSDEEGATVGIYDRLKLAELDKGPNGVDLRAYSPDPKLILMADLSRADLEHAKVAEAHIRYGICPVRPN